MSEVIGYQMLVGEFSLVNGEFSKKYLWCLMNTLNTSPDYTDILAKDPRDVLKLLFTRNMAAFFKYSCTHKKIALFPVSQAFIRDVKCLSPPKIIMNKHACL